ncbi:MAG: hypothetical protein JO189_00990 [Deltaproteobacteria bacterium]|nr:hypothetical protein [Deltaproteobacteria bacterium]
MARTSRSETNQYLIKSQSANGTYQSAPSLSSVRAPAGFELLAGEHLLARNPYYRVASEFFNWCDQAGLGLFDIEPVHVAA